MALKQKQAAKAWDGAGELEALITVLKDAGCILLDTETKAFADGTQHRALFRTSADEANSLYIIVTGGSWRLATDSVGRDGKPMQGPPNATVGAGRKCAAIPGRYTACVSRTNPERRKGDKPSGPVVPVQLASW